MSDPLPTPPPNAFVAGPPPAQHDGAGVPSSSTSIAYRPISGFAIAGFVAGCVFALLMLAMVAVALLQAAPFFFSPLILVVPAAGAVLSLVARGQIRGSEGTQAGERLAWWGIALSVFTGLGYGVYYLVTGLAVTSQANAFMMDLGEDSGFFPHLQKSATSRKDFNEAFLLTLTTGSRASVRPDDDSAMRKQYDLGNDGGPGLMTQFRQSILARQFSNSSASATVEPLGAQSWEYKEQSYIVTRTYRITTPEAVAEFTVVARSNEGESAGEQRKWFVDLKMSGPRRIDLTALGANVMRLRIHSQGAVDHWRAEVNAGKPFDFKAADVTAWQRLPISQAQRDYVRERMIQLMDGTQKNGALGLSFARDEPWPEWEAANGKVRMDHPFRLNLEPRGTEPPYGLEGKLIVESATPVDPAAASAEPEWIVRNIVITRAVPSAKKGGPSEPKGVP